MATPSEINQGASYVGNSGLGGGYIPAITLDTRPIEDLAKYTFLRNKSEYDQRQKDADEKIKQLAEMTAFDPSTAIENDKNKAKELYDKLIEYSSEYSRKTPKDSSDKVQQYWDYQKEIATTQKGINSIKGRAISYNKRMDDIDKDTTLTDAQKKVKRDAVKKAANTDIYTSIPLEDEFNEKIPEIAAAVPRELEFSSKLPNDNVSHKVEMVTSTDLLRQSQAEATGLEATFNGAHKDFFGASDNPYKIFHDSANSYNAALADPKYQSLAPNGQMVVDYQQIQQDNPTLHNVVGLIEGYNTWATNMKGQAQRNLFEDRLGKGYSSVTGVTADDFFTIDPNKPLTGDKIVMLEKWRKSAGKLLAIDETLISTDNAIQGQQIATQRRGQDIGLLSDREGRALTKWIAENKPAKAGTTASQQLSEYPIMKTDELVQTIGSNGTTFSQLTTEQQAKIKARVNGIDVKRLPDAVVTISGNIINVKSGSTIVKINADDIAKTYYDEINTTDAGKEAVQRIYYDRTKTTAEVDEFGVPIPKK